MRRKRGEKGKAQSAMEYLMTYGWAILIIAVVLGVLFQLGIFSGGNLAPKAPPGACEVLRTATVVSLEGECQGQLPEFVAQFPGQTNANVLIQTSSMLNPTSGFSKLTVTAWINQQASVGACQDAVSQYGTSSVTGHGFILRPGSCGVGGPMQYYISISATWYQCTTAALTLGTWYFTALTYDGSTLTGYENTATCTVTGLSGAIVSTTGLTAFGGNEQGSEPFTGGIADVQIYNTSLSSSEVQALYLEGIGGAPIRLANLVGWWPLNGDVRDYSGQGNDGAVNGGVAFNSTWNSKYTPP